MKTDTGRAERGQVAGLHSGGWLAPRLAEALVAVQMRSLRRVVDVPVSFD
ncbi:MAG: hypothetical protein IJJ33_01705 [Victivallales bacterium]|nr:hypothetical protein [Victivallales bacterium]